jgi:uncharacterized protein (DUF4415 family)
MSRKRKNTLTSLDGKRRITKREFDRLFDTGSDEIDAFVDWSKVDVDIPGPKRPVALRLDADVLDWFRSSGKGYQTRINAVLRSYKRAREAAAAKGK